jgi:hypothetical protein
MISRVVEKALADVTLADLVRGRPSPVFSSVSAMLQIERSDDAERPLNADPERSN